MRTKNYNPLLLCSLLGCLIPQPCRAEATATSLPIPAPVKHQVKQASSPQKSYSGNHSVTQAIDGSLTTPNWHAPGQLEVQGDFTFAAPVKIDYINFDNANFTELEIETLQQGKNIKLGKFTLGGSKVLRFAKPLEGVEALSIKVSYAQAAQANFALREIEFMQKPDIALNRELLKVFKDGSCSELKASYKQSDLAALPALLQNVAKHLQQKNYPEAAFRLGSYQAYSHPEYAAKVRNINALSPLDNPTGILARQGQEIVVLVGPTNGQNISLACVPAYGLSINSYPLSEGVNKLRVNNTGLLYVMYHADLADKKPAIKLHIPIGSGELNGYFDIRRHNDKDWQKILAAAKYDVIDIVGKYSMMILDSKHLRQYSPDNITRSVEVWDRSVAAMWKIMGFDKYPQAHNNRQLGISTQGGSHMFASWYFCGYSNGNNGQTLKNEVIAPGILNGNKLWGIGHEIGHCYQHPINWRSMSESSNNFFAQLILDQVVNPINGNELASDMENPCKYLQEDAVAGKPFHDFNGWAKWGFAQYSFYLYFHKLGIDQSFYPRLFESLRRKPLSTQSLDVTEAHLAWYERVCEISKTDFTEDFELFNWFVPIDIRGNQYGEYVHKMSAEQAAAAKQRVAAKKYPKPKYRVAFLHQHGKTVELYGQKLHGSQLNGFWKNYLKPAKLPKDLKATLAEQRVTVSSGKNAAAFCVKTDGKIVGWFDRCQFDIKGLPWNDSSEIYAVPMQSAEAYKCIYRQKDALR